MNKEVQSIIKRIDTVNSGQPWFGRAVIELLEEVNPKIVFEKPDGKDHSLIELLYHMNVWADFTLKRLEKDTVHDIAYFEALDWRTIDPQKHSWKKGIAEFKSIHKKIIAILANNDDSFLEEIVDFRKYNFRFLLNGLIEHNIYHAGQVAYLSKMLS